MPKKSYEDILISFKNYNCELLHDKDEFSKVYINCNSKLEIIASCYHTYSISYHTFNRNKNNIVCQNCRYNKLSEKFKIEHSKENFNKLYLESNSIKFLEGLIFKYFEVKRTFEGCKADIAIKPKNVCEDKWIGIQIKTTLKKVNKKNNVGYNFSICKEYDNMITICIACEDNKLWIFENNDIKHIKSGLTIRNNSKYNKFEVDKENLTNILLDKYTILTKFSFNELDLPICDKVKLEYEYRKLRENNISFINFINNEHQGESFDFKIGNKKIQEKVSSMRNINIESYIFNLHKTCGIKNKNKKRTRQNYKIGDCDIYWLHCKDITKFYVVPENILIAKGYVGNINGTPKSLTISKTNKNTFWMNDYLFDYKNLDKEKLCKILL
jgi:hypothetical protein